ncbi:hypothetical protein [Paraburkholderia sp. SIMBA_054]|uniref:hypothetical protein n=1 Tax=Paraburkholderia sp. SIMBA_054 TaxID=3085795 RepID=UPI00397B7AF2
MARHRNRFQNNQPSRDHSGPQHHHHHYYYGGRRSNFVGKFMFLRWLLRIAISAFALYVGFHSLQHFMH